MAIKCLEADAAPETAEQWIRATIREFGLGFHFDTDPSDYTDDHGNHLDEAVQANLRVSIERVFEALGSSRPYDIGLSEFRRIAGFEQVSS